VLAGEREGGFSSAELLVVPLVLPPLELVPKGLHQAEPWPTMGFVVSVSHGCNGVWWK
jgi:hypothetical protein